jgi:hypothetical protein
VLASLKQNAPARGRTLLLIYVVIEAMITFFAILDNTRIGLFGQSLFPGLGGCSQYSPRKPGREAVSLSIEPPEGVRENVIWVLNTLAPDSNSLIVGSAFLKGVRFSHPWLVLKTGEQHLYSDVLSGGVGA